MLRGGDVVGFRVGRYDRTRPLVIDPVLVLASNLWGTATGVALDPAGNIYVTGSVWTSDLPVAGGYQTQQAGTQDAYVMKLDPTGTAALFTTYLGARRARTPHGNDAHTTRSLQTSVARRTSQRATASVRRK